MGLNFQLVVDLFETTTVANMQISNQSQLSVSHFKATILQMSH